MSLEIRSETSFQVAVAMAAKMLQTDAKQASSMANLIDQAPFEAYAVTCGLTFTFGGLKTSTAGEGESTDGGAIPGLFAAGELVGGLFYHNYPGGAGLVSGAVLGKLAGDGAGLYVKGKN